MIKFRTRYDDDIIPVVNSSGKRLQDVYELDPDGNCEFDIRLSDQKHDIQDYIDSFEGLTDANTIIDRFRNGDVTAITPLNQFQFGDISNIPDNIQEIAKRVDDAYNLFNSLDPAVKSHFNSADDFYRSYGTEKFTNAFKKETVEELKSDNNPIT